MNTHERSQHVANLLAQMSDRDRNAWRNPDNWDGRCYPSAEILEHVSRKSLRPACIPNQDLAWLAERERCFPTSPKDTPGSTQTSTYTTLSKSGLLCPPVGDIGVGHRKPRGNDHK